jgi:hypothetical protein
VDSTHLISEESGQRRIGLALKITLKPPGMSSMTVWHESQFSPSRDSTIFKSGLNVFEQSQTDNNKCAEIQLHIAKTLSDNLPQQTTIANA